MNAGGLLVLSSLFYGLSLFCSCQWYVPWIRNLFQKPIERQLRRCSEIGFDESALRNITFAIELIVTVGLAWLGVNYLEPVLTVTVFAISLHLRGLIFDWIIETRERLLRSQTLSFTTGLMGLTRGGLSLSQAFDTIAQESSLPLGKFVKRIANENQRGRPLVEAIDAVRSQLRLDAFSLLVTSIACALKQGSSLEASLTGVQESLEHRDHAERQLFAKTSSARMTILILSATTPGFFLMFWFMMPDSMNLIFHTSGGKKLVAVILLLMYCGVAWSRKLLNIK
ncbi:MAG: type II secretion system F family protein [Pirellulaceae bacterium]|nr:type II secretion system F family protein [Pirellulaceae bacterium]